MRACHLHVHQASQFPACDTAGTLATIEFIASHSLDPTDYGSFDPWIRLLVKVFCHFYSNTLQSSN